MSESMLSNLKQAATALRDDEVHVWHVAYRPSLGRQPLLHVLAAYLDCAESTVSLEIEEYGRPGLSARFDRTLDFNWSHSGEDALIAIGRNVRPGIDVERVRARPRLLEIARRYFEPAEFSMLEGLPESARLPAFLSMWTAKEAVLKALGRGIAFGLDRVVIEMEREGVPTLRRLGNSDVSSWQLRSLPFGSGLCAVLAWQGKSLHIYTGKLAARD